MRVRMCPLCDSEMTKKHHCDICNSWVWKPQILDIHYDAQDRGKGEIDCAYGDFHDSYHHEDIFSSASTSADDIQKMRDLKWQLQQKYAGKSRVSQKKESYAERYSMDAESQNRKSRRETKREQKKKSSIILTIIIALIGMNAAAVVNAVSDGWNFIEEEIVELIEPERTPERDDGPAEILEADGIIYLSDGDLANYPEGCTAQAHFDIQGYELENIIEDGLSDAGIMEYESYTYEDNYIYSDDYSEIVALNCEVNYAFSEASEYSNYNNITYNSDSVTGQLHYITLSLYSLDLAETMLLLMIAATDSSLEEGEIADVCETIFAHMQEDGFVYTVGNMDIYAQMGDGDGIWISILPVNNVI